MGDGSLWLQNFCKYFCFAIIKFRFYYGLRKSEEGKLLIRQCTWYFNQKDEGKKTNEIQNKTIETFTKNEIT